jgi:hypothetical protein
MTAHNLLSQLAFLALLYWVSTQLLHTQFLLLKSMSSVKHSSILSTWSLKLNISQGHWIPNLSWLLILQIVARLAPYHTRPHSQKPCLAQHSSISLNWTIKEVWMSGSPCLYMASCSLEILLSFEIRFSSAEIVLSLPFLSWIYLEHNSWSYSSTAHAELLHWVLYTLNPNSALQVKFVSTSGL